jgi:hypothetical protein
MSKTTENDPFELKLSPAFIAAAELRQAKRDYGGIRVYFPFGHKSYVQMIHVKTQRLVNLIESGVPPENESIDDSLLDLLNYASYYYEWRKGVLDE